MKLHLWHSSPHGDVIADHHGRKLRALACYIHLKPVWPSLPSGKN